MNRVSRVILMAIVLLITSRSTFGEGLSTNRLAITLEEQEGTGDNLTNAIADEFNALIIQESTPILVPLALWDRFILFRHIVEDVSTLSPEEIAKKHAPLQALLGNDYDICIKAMKLTIDALNAYKKNDIKKGKKISKELNALLKTAQYPNALQFFISSSLLTSRVVFNADDWYGTQFNNRFLLLVPKKYADTMGNNLGLKIDRVPMPDELLDLAATWQRFENRTNTKPKESLGSAFLKTFETIFDQEHNNLPAPRWAIVLSGHGGQEKFNPWIINKDFREAENLKYLISSHEKELLTAQQALESKKSGLILDRKNFEKNYENPLFKNSVYHVYKRKDYKKPFSKKSLYQVYTRHTDEQDLQQLEEEIQKLKTTIKNHKEAIAQKSTEFDLLLQHQQQFHLRSEELPKSEPILAALTINEFKHLLNFLSTKIITAVFVETSCFSGSNIYKAYSQNQESFFVEKHPFVIASAGLTETMVGLLTVQDFAHYPPHETATDIKKYKDTYVRALIDFKKFFSMLEADKPVDWEKAFDLVFNYKKYPENTPLIKFPGTEWLTTPRLNEEILSISKVMSATRDPLKDLIIHNQKSILLYAQETPFSLKYLPTMYNLAPLITSMVPKDSYHKLKNIYAPTYKASDILKSFFGYPDLQNRKIFSIESIKALNDILPNRSEKIIDLKDIFCINHWDDQLTVSLFGPLAFEKNNNIICFTVDNKTYGWFWPSEREINLSVQQPQNPHYKPLIQKKIDNFLGKKRWITETEMETNTFTPQKREPLIKLLEKKAQILKEKNSKKHADIENTAESNAATSRD